ncbi:4a-hydroxytetrahydrobiopterin dehydratase [Leptospira sp. id769339]|uniref:4a-hydroxytetrahydrobiopterin dehydratase n=1 Tax=unclassified Leptospira TaxID=2633828 RepID=UPI00055C90B6|nr:4a-hydroxytetrahydrobiopterin dehydratase [Leptospira sp. id769339]MCR1792480.1 4a-hydroxytetrahydrobiopterin dehydratase [Leptospira sp. id769339]
MDNSPISLSIEQIRKELPATWEIATGDIVPRIVRVYDLSQYLDGIKIIKALANLANEMDHHPEIFFSYRSVRVELYTHTLKGLSSFDLQFAISAENLLNNF